MCIRTSVFCMFCNSVIIIHTLCHCILPPKKTYLLGPCLFTTPQLGFVVVVFVQSFPPTSPPRDSSPSVASSPPRLRGGEDDENIVEATLRVVVVFAVFNAALGIATFVGLGMIATNDRGGIRGAVMGLWRPKVAPAVEEGGGGGKK